MSDNLSQILKQATKRVHAETEKQMDAKAIFSDSYSLKAYKAHLLHLLQMHSVGQRIFAQNKQQLPRPDLLPADPTAKLKADLAAVGMPIEELHCKLKNKAAFDSTAALVGLMYVLKGSALGSNIIATQIAKHRKRWQVPEAQFYAQVEAQQLQEDWANWCEQINALASNEAFVHQAVEGAIKAFELCKQPRAFAHFELLTSS